MCGASALGRLLGQHVRLDDFPWYFAPELACWTCQKAVTTSSELRAEHRKCGATFSSEVLGKWLEVMKALLLSLKSALSQSGDKELIAWIASNSLYSREGGLGCHQAGLFCSPGWTSTWEGLEWRSQYNPLTAQLTS